MKWLNAVLFLLLALLVTPTTAQTDTFQPILSYGRGIPQQVSWQPDGNIVLVNSITGAWLYSSDDLSDLAHFENLLNATFSPDGRWLVGANERGETQIYDSNRLEIVTLPDGFGSTNFSPDGNWLLGDIGGKPILLDTDTFTAIDLPAEYVKHPPQYTIWSPNSLKLLAVNGDTSLSVWRIGDTVPLFTLRPEINNYPQWSPDSRKISLNERTDNRVHIWDADTGNLLLELPPQERQSPNLEWANDGATVWHPDSVRIFRFYPSNDAVEIEIYDTDGNLLSTLPTSQLFNIWYSPDGQRLAVTDGLYDLDTYEKLADIYVEFVLKWSPDNRWIAVMGGISSILQVMDGKTGEIIYRLDEHIQAFSSRYTPSRNILWSPDSARLLSWNNSGEFLLWDRIAGKLLTRLDNHINLSVYATFNTDGSLLAAADSMGKVRLWNLQTGNLIKTISDHLAEVDTLLWQPDGNLLATQNAQSDSIYWDGVDDRNIIYIWNGETGELVHTITAQTSLTSATWSPDGSKFYTGNDRNNFVRIWDIDTGEETTIELNVGGGYVTYPDISWSPDQKILLFDYNYATHGGQLIRLYDATNGRLLADQIRYFSPSWYAWNQDDRKLRIADPACPPYSSVNCTIVIRTIFDPADYPTHIDIYAYDIPADMVLGAYKQFPTAYWSPNGKLLAVTDQETTWIWEIENKSKQLLLTIRNAAFVMWSPDSTKVATHKMNGDSAQVEVIEIATSTVILNLPESSIQGWSPDSGFLAVGEGYTHSSLWSISSGQQIASLDGKPAVWSADGSGYADLSGGIIRVWRRE